MAPVDPVGPVTFDRLLSVAVLTPAQASFVAVKLLDAALVAGSSNGGRPPPTGLGVVTVTSAGDVDVGPALPGAGTPVTQLLEQLLQNARRLPVHPRPGQLLLLHRLEDAATDPSLDPAARARELEGALADTLGPGAQQLLTGQLVALVQAFAHVAPGGPGRVDADLSSPPPEPVARPLPRRAAPPPPAGRPPRRGRVLLRRRSQGRTAVIALALVAVLAVSGYVVLGGAGADIVGSIGRGDRPTAPGTTAPAQPATQDPTRASKPERAQVVASIAPLHAGAITGVALQKTGSCKPAALCPVTVTVHFRAASTTRTVGWKVGVARLCERGITWSPLVAVTAQPGWTTVYASSAVRVPKGRSLTLVALTSTPDRARSRLVPVTGSSVRC